MRFQKAVPPLVFLCSNEALSVSECGEYVVRLLHCKGKDLSLFR